MGKPPKGSRNWLAWQRAEELLADGEWHYTSMVVDAMCAAGGIQKKTATNLLSEAVGWGVVERQGYKHGLHHGGYVDRRMVRSIPDKEARFARERAGHVTEPPEQGYSPAPLRGGALHEAGPPGTAEQTSRTGKSELLDRIRTEIEQERLRLGPAPSPNVNVDVTPQPVNPPNKEFTWEEAQRLQRKARRRRPPDQPSGY